MVKLRRWDPLIRQLGGDPMYHSVGYHRASAHLEPPGTIPVLLHQRGSTSETALPVLLRPLPGGHGWDATTVYGYGGPISSGSIEDPEFGEAVDEWARENDVIATFIRYHPLLGNHVLGPKRAELVQQGFTASWRLHSGQDLLLGMHPHHRRATRKADRAGLEVRVTRGPADLGAFRAQYEATMKRQNAEPFYYFPDPYWTALVRGCERNLLLVEGLLGGRTVASILCLVGPPYLHYHLGASDEEGRRIGASNRLFLAAARWAQANGLSQFHLGGGLGASPDSPLYTFKQRFDPTGEPRPFYVAKWVHDPGHYRALTGTASTAGHFPPWRR